MAELKFIKRARDWFSSLFGDEYAQLISDQHSAAEGRAEQFDIIRANIGSVAIGNIFAGFLAVLTFVGSDQFVSAIIWFLGFLVVISLSMGRFRTRYADQGSNTSSNGSDKPARFANSDKSLLLTSTILALAWITLPIMLFGSADMEQRLFIVATMLSLLGAGAFFLSGVPRAATTYSVIMMSGLLAAIFLNWHSAMMNSAVLIVSFTLLVIGMVRKNADYLIDRTQARHALIQSNDMIGVLLREHDDSGYEWLWETGPQGNIRNVSKKFAEAAGVGEKHLLGILFTSILVDQATSCVRKDGGKMDNIEKAFAADKPFRDIIVSYQHPKEGVRWWKLSGRPIVERGKKPGSPMIGYRGVALDITDEKNSEDKIAYLALYDSLTNLPNRASFKEQIECSIAKTVANLSGKVQTGENGMALFLLDLDKFKHINDTLGHPAGDELLIQVARRLSTLCSGAAIVARLGGDEFAIVVEGISTATAARQFATRLIKCFDSRFLIAGRQIGINCSIGVALAPDQGRTSVDLISNADLALYRAKTDNNSSCNVFEAVMDLRVRERRQLGQELQSAILNDELFLLYQPLISTATSEIIGYEALVRWNNPRCGIVNPTHFIPIAEELGMIVDIGKWVIGEACAEAANWKNNRRVSVNLSPLQFVGIQLELMVARALGDSGLLPSRLELEITENSLMVNKEATLTTLQNLRNLGISIALDDFGTGYSSLSYLMSYPFDKIKVDRSFLSSDDNMGNNAALIRTIIGLAKSLGMRSTVEGVETLEQLELLKREGCDELQGYLISPPMLASEVREQNSADILLKVSGHQRQAS